MDKLVRNIRKTNAENVQNLRASNSQPVMSEDIDEPEEWFDAGTHESANAADSTNSDVNHGSDRVLTADDLAAVVMAKAHEYDDGVPIPGRQNLPQNMRDVLQYIANFQVHQKGDPDKVNDLIDDAILRMRVEGINIRGIATRLQMSEEKVSTRLSAVLNRQMQQMTSSEYRQLQLNRIEEIINMIWKYAEMGDPEQTRNLMLAVERLNKLLDLETEKNIIEINIVTDAQTKLIIAATLGVLDKVLQIPQIADLGLEQRVIDGVVSEAMEEAGRVIQEAAEVPLTIDRKELTK